MGDSGTYLYTALTGWIPDDRSFTYGFLIRPLTVLPHTLVPLLVFQTLLGAISAWIVGCCLLKYFRAPRWLATICTLLCAIEPLQLFAERCVLTETVSIFLFAVVVWLSLDYLASGRLVSLAGIQIVSVVLISIRVSYLPLVEVDSILLPLIGPAAAAVLIAVRARRNRTGDANSGILKPALRFAANILVGALLCQAVLYGYRNWNGALLDRPPAYNYADGIFLASFWAPVIEARDFPIPDLRGPIFDHLKYDLKNPKNRQNHCFSVGGLCENIRKETRAKFGDDPRTSPNKLAKKAALRAAKRNPLGLLRLFVVTAEEYFEPSYFRTMVTLEEGSIQTAGADFDKELRENFNQPYAPLRSTLVQRWHLAAIPWYRFLLFAPLVFAILAIGSGRKNVAEKLFFAVAIFGLTLEAIALTQEPTVRYMIGEAWLVPLALGATSALLLSDKRIAVARESRSELGGAPKLPTAEHRI